MPPTAPGYSIVVLRGCPSTRGILSSKQAHPGARPAQIVAAGFAISGSSSVPARAKTSRGRDSDAVKTCVPQTGQNRRCIFDPLSATL